MATTWLITGASRGFGRALAEAVLAAGDQLVATARRPEQLADLVDRHGDRVRAVALDVTDQAAAHDAVRAGVEAFGRLDVVVNNAGYANSGPIEEMADADFRAQFEANFFGVVNVTRAALPVLRGQRSGTFVQFSSLGGRVGGTPGMGAYQSAKFAVEGFSEVLASEVAPFGVKVVIVEPGAFRTDWQGSSMELHTVGADYEETVGAMNTYRAENNGTQPGDPVRAAEVLIGAVRDDDPPRRLLLGAQAVAMALEAGEARAAETRKWAAAGAAADFPAGA
ncbi:MULTISPECIES: oxidoreductase [unclassified Streptomyces]|uniref:oxidoreductase n=1 Tax=unclassified Streptomyces TaxID=2593676 RepID=UPI000DBAD084|nr:MULTISPECIES: oxidoreductase [unclassified Streptomyces]MYT71749.1 SDR family NAD(P)-dependent oxidoreductase [Streptomyces sp. SID8367]RAJ72583.1 NADP-dependent 3-hydroxy acid dehydrogenase YdfG [Streptomyces sp. PsTaAH-137]